MSTQDANQAHREGAADDPGLTRSLRPPDVGAELAAAEQPALDSQRVLLHVYRALQEKGYDPIGQIAHYLLSGEPTYITGHRNARALMTCLERDEIIAELVRSYIVRLTGENPAGRRA